MPASGGIKVGTLFVYFKQRREGRRRQSTGDSVRICLQGGNSPEDSQGDCRMKLVELLVWSDSSKFSRKSNRGSKMATEGHRYAGRKELWIQEDIDEELIDIKK
jgi:hypothetical protein